MIDIDFDDLRKEVAIKHNVLLGSDDPILVTVTLNEFILSRYLQAAAEQQHQINRELTIALQQHQEQAKDVAGRIITNAAGYVTDEIKQAVKMALVQASAEMEAQKAASQIALSDCRKGSLDAQTAKNGAVMAALLAVAAAIICTGTLVVFLLK